MSCALKEQHPLDALYRACKAYPGGIEGLAARLKVKPGTLYNKLRSQVESHRIGYAEELSEILFCLAEARVPNWQATIHAIAWRHGMLAIDVPQSINESHEALAVLICETVREQSEVVAAIGRALADDNQIDSKEFADIECCMEVALTGVASLRERVREMHQEAKARGLVR